MFLVIIIKLASHADDIYIYISCFLKHDTLKKLLGGIFQDNIFLENLVVKRTIARFTCSQSC